MSDPKTRLTKEITDARAALERALVDLAEIPAFDPGTTALFVHALNNYLTVSLASLEFLRPRLMGHPDPEVHSLLDGLDHTTELMVHGVSRLQGEVERAQLDHVQIDLGMIILRAVKYYQKIADKKEMSLVAPPLGEDVQLWSDGATVAAILDNLISNAIKYSPHGAKVWVQVLGDENGVTCEVRDQGPGLSLEDQARLFHRGVQLTPKPTGGERSHGYGLAVAKELISRLGGTIGCRSELEKGSCFWFRLPRRRPQVGVAEEGPI